MRKGSRGYVAVWVCFVLAQAAAICRISQAGQAGAASPAAVRPIGVVTQIQPGKLALHTDGGTELAVELPDGVTAVRVPPGSKDLKSATQISVSDINAGDRVLVRGKVADDQKSVVATTVIVMSRSAIASAHEAERLDWQRRGVGGLVKAVDPATRLITISVPTSPPTAGNPTHPLTISLASNAALMRYAPDSVKFSDASPGSFEDIKVGDQVRALGTKSADGNSFTAEKVVSGTFRNLAATVISVDAPGGTATVKDLATGKPVLVRTNADSKLHRLPPFVAQAIATLNSGGAAAAGTAGRSAGSGSERGRGGQGGQGGGQRGGANGGQRSGVGAGPRDFQQMLDHMPPLSLSELKAEDALIVVSTGGANPSEATAIVLLAGVEPILAARPKGSNQVVLPPWTMGMGGGEGEGGP
jgi:hypothetical protein